MVWKALTTFILLLFALSIGANLLLSANSQKKTEKTTNKKAEITYPIATTHKPPVNIDETTLPQLTEAQREALRAMPVYSGQEILDRLLMLIESPNPANLTKEQVEEVFGVELIDNNPMLSLIPEEEYRRFNLYNRFDNNLENFKDLQKFSSVFTPHYLLRFSVINKQQSIFSFHTIQVYEEKVRARFSPLEMCIRSWKTKQLLLKKGWIVASYDFGYSYTFYFSKESSPAVIKIEGGRCIFEVYFFTASNESEKLFQHGATLYRVEQEQKEEN